MRLIFLLGAFLVLSSFTDVEVKTKKKQLQFGFEEVYCVLKSDKAVKHGEYLFRNMNWVFQKGTYVKGVKAGIWSYYIGDKLEFSYDFDSKKVVSDTLGKSRLALFSEGMVYLELLKASNLSYPEKSMENGISGTVVVAIVVSKEGVPVDFKIEASSGVLELNKESLRVAQIIARQHPWIPGINEQGEPVESVVFCPFNFRAM
ncbi:energy transducer TonB [Alistipes sp. ZOR0009]|uniref:energy transducer TonB n=1 Tax=Alistipes sp. ZOR0009 TaxID=1339253 RepID=UPI000645D1E7|nr:energy transducer TonB [Alistipes sp. ZOR0009]